MRVYTLPDFNIVFDYWAQGLTPAAFPSTYANVPCQHYFNARVGLVNFATLVRTPKDLTKAFGYTVAGSAPPFPIMEVPSGSGRYFIVRMCRVAHEGFPNEYWVLTGTACDNTGAAIDGHLP